jgi:hypothetical protein
MEPSERLLRDRLDATLHIARWARTSKEQVILMLEGALEASPEIRCTCANPERGKVELGDLDRNCPLHGVVAEDDI